LVVVREVLCKSVLSKSRIYGVDYSVNPYLGCQHSCSYCYARFMLKYHRRREEWGEFVDVKVNSPRVLSKELPKAKVGSILLSSVTDPYQPIEEKYGLTRKILERLLTYDFPVSILTKSSLVLRDIDLLRRFKKCEVGLTITTLSEDVKKCFEPFSSKIEGRLNALRVLHDEGIRTFVFLGPLLPLLVEDSLEGLAHEFIEAGVSEILVDRLNIKYGNWKTIKESLEKCYPGLLREYERILFSGSDYFEELKNKVAKHFWEKKLNFKFCY